MVMLNMNDELESESESESLSWEDSYFELELGPADDADDFEFRVSISTVVPTFPATAPPIFHHPTTAILSSTAHAHAHAHAAAPIIDLTPTHLITTTTTTCRKTVGGKMNRSMMMKLLVKLRSIISTRPFDRLFGQRSCDEFQMVRRSRRNNINLFGGRSPASASASASATSIIPSPHPQLAHHSSLLHAAIAHCNKSNSFSFSL